MKKLNKKSNHIFNMVLLVFIITASTYAWMLTNPSTGELIDYERNLIINSSSVNVEFYTFKDNDYVLTTSDPITTDLLGPGMIQKYLFKITNNNSTPANVNIIFSDITGNIELLKEVFLIGESNPLIFENRLSSKFVQNPSTLKYSYMFHSDLEIGANSTLNLYWYIGIDKFASNEIKDTSVSINKIMFVKP